MARNGYGWPRIEREEWELRWIKNQTVNQKIVSISDWKEQTALENEFFERFSLIKIVVLISAATAANIYNRGNITEYVMGSKC